MQDPQQDVNKMSDGHRNVLSNYLISCVPSKNNNCFICIALCYVIALMCVCRICIKGYLLTYLLTYLLLLSVTYGQCNARPYDYPPTFRRYHINTA